MATGIRLGSGRMLLHLLPNEPPKGKERSLLRIDSIFSSKLAI